MDQTLFAVNLPEESFSTPYPGTVLPVVSLLLVWQYISQRSIRGKIQSANFLIDLPDRAKLTCPVNVSLDIDRFQAVREAPGFLDSIILFDMLAGTCDSQEIEQGKVIEAKHFNQTNRKTITIIKIQPAIELFLC